MSHYETLTRELTDPARQELRVQRMQQIEEQIFEKCAALMEAHLDAAEVDPDQQEPPPEWVERWGLDVARRRLIFAKMGYLPASQMPSAVKLSGQYVLGVVKGRQSRIGKLTQNVLNVKIALPAPTSAEHPTPEIPAYPVREIE